MRRVLVPFALLGTIACASAPRGPSDAEVRASLEANVTAIVQEVGSGNFAALASRFEPEGRLVIDNVRGPNGVIDQTFVGGQQIRQFMSSIGAPPQFTMAATESARTGDTATQTGTWSVGGGEVSGDFILEWRRAEDETWRIMSWRLNAT